MDIITLKHYKGLPLPAFGTADAASIDLRAALPHDIELAPGHDYVIPSGLKIHIGSQDSPVPGTGLVGLIMPRSGLGFKHYTRLANTTGVIDADYQGEIMIKIRNEGENTLIIEQGMRVCQMMFTLYIKGIEFNQVDEFGTETERGAGGLGSTGTK